MAKQFLTTKAHAEIKSQIIHFQLKPGLRLRIDELASSLGMSQTPVREALSKLEQERLVERLPQKGFAVRGLSIQEVEDLYELRVAMEVLAAQQAARRMSPSARRRLRELLANNQIFIDKGERAQTLRLSQEVHVVIMEGSGNRLLCETGRGILDRIWMIQNLNILTSDHMRDAQREHLTIVDAIDAGDVHEAGELMRAHLVEGKDFLVARLRDHNDFLSTILEGGTRGRELRD